MTNNTITISDNNNNNNIQSFFNDNRLFLTSSTDTINQESHVLYLNSNSATYYYDQISHSPLYYPISIQTTDGINIVIDDSIEFPNQQLILNIQDVTIYSSSQDLSKQIILNEFNFYMYSDNFNLTIQYLNLNKSNEFIKYSNNITSGTIVFNDCNCNNYFLNDNNLKLNITFNYCNVIRNIRDESTGGFIKNSCSNCTFNNCTYGGDINNNNCGGFIAKNSTNCIFNNCQISGRIINADNSGGFVGSKSTNINFNNCSIDSNFYIYSKYSGGYVGSSSSYCYFKNCTSKIQINANYVGGFVGPGFQNGSFQNSSYQSSTSILNQNCGGFIASANDNLASINNFLENCTSEVDIAGDNSGGFIGSYGSNISFLTCNSNCNLITNQNCSISFGLGGFMGGYSNNSDFNTCNYNGNIKTTNSGGFVASNSIANYYIYCSSSGNLNTDNCGGYAGSSSNANEYLYCNSNININGFACGGYESSNSISSLFKFSSSNCPIINDKQSNNGSGGYIGSNAISCVFIQSKYNGNIFTAKSGGFAADNSFNLIFNNCNSSGIINKEECGGFVGLISSNNIFTYCSSSFDINAKYSGGFCGHKATNIIIDRSSSECNLYVNNSAGFCGGKIGGNINFTNSYYWSNVYNVNNSVAALANIIDPNLDGYIITTATISNCFWLDLYPQADMDIKNQNFHFLYNDNLGQNLNINYNYYATIFNTKDAKKYLNFTNQNQNVWNDTVSPFTLNPQQDSLISVNLYSSSNILKSSLYSQTPKKDLDKSRFYLLTVNSNLSINKNGNITISDKNNIKSIDVIEINALKQIINYKINLLSTPVCFLNSTKILCFENNLEILINIEHIRQGIYIKTYKEGYKKVLYVFKLKMLNTIESSKNKLYKIVKEDNNDLIEDLYITGEHSILVDKEQNENNLKIHDKYLIKAYESSLFSEINDNKIYNLYHLVLENNQEDDINKQYGIYANGILTESLSLYNYLIINFSIKCHNIKYQRYII